MSDVGKMLLKIYFFKNGTQALENNLKNPAVHVNEILPELLLWKFSPLPYDPYPPEKCIYNLLKLGTGKPQKNLQCYHNFRFFRFRFLDFKIQVFEFLLEEFL